MDEYKNIRIKIICSDVYSRYIWGIVIQIVGRYNKVKQITLVWTCTENVRKQNSRKSIIYEFGNNKIES